jgi:hypothetical protein
MSSETVSETKPCRTCSECEGYHHFIEVCDVETEDGQLLAEPFVGYGCKHCGERREMCEGCEEIVEIGRQFCAACTAELS